MSGPAGSQWGNRARITSTSSRVPQAASVRSPEPFASQQRRSEALEILQSYEKLSWQSFQRCESLAQTRMHFRNIIAGFTPADEAAQVDWREDLTPRPRAGAAKGSRKGKERVSGVGVDGVTASPAGASGGRGKQRESLGGVDGQVTETGSARKRRGMD